MDWKLVDEGLVRLGVEALPIAAALSQVAGLSQRKAPTINP